jgi:hypothetical protein
MGLARAATDGAHVVSYERLRRGDYFADFRRDRRLSPEVYHCVIQRDGSTEIVAWSQFHSLDEAQQFAEKHMRDLSGTDGNQPSS